MIPLQLITFVYCPVLMHNTLKVFKGSTELFNELEKEFKRHVNQIGDKQYRFFFQANIQISSTSPSLDGIIDLIVEHTDAKLKPKILSKYRHHLQIIILNLAKAVLHRQWCMIPMDSKVFGKGAFKNLSYRSFSRAIETMEKLGFIRVVKGKKYSTQPLRTAIQPQSLLNIDSLMAYLESSEEPQSPFVNLNNKRTGYTLTDSDIKIMEQDELDLKRINRFLSSHSWAAKSAMTRLYSGEVGLSGRIYCAFQQLPQRRIRVRQNCLIDGEEISEVDIKSSHMRMAVALFYNQKLERDFYKGVFDATNVYESKVKSFCQFAFSCESKIDALSAFKSKVSSEKDFIAIERHLFERFPDIPFYQGWSKKAMNLEGEIVKKVMLQGVNDDVVVLPIHDAVAVQKKHQAWAEKTMIKIWSEVVGVDACEVG